MSLRLPSPRSTTFSTLQAVQTILQNRYLSPDRGAIARTTVICDTRQVFYWIASWEGWHHEGATSPTA